MHSFGCWEGNVTPFLAVACSLRSQHTKPAERIPLEDLILQAAVLGAKPVVKAQPSDVAQTFQKYPALAEFEAKLPCLQ
jgi:hypothetical protein